MKTNFALQRRNMWQIIKWGLIIELCIIIFFGYNNGPGNYIWTGIYLFIALITNIIILWIIDKKCFNTQNILNNIAKRKTRVNEQIENTKDLIKSIGIDPSQKEKKKCKRLKKKLCELQDELIILNFKNEFFLKTQRKNLWSYAKDKITLNKD